MTLDTSSVFEDRFFIPIANWQIPISMNMVFNDFTEVKWFLLIDLYFNALLHLFFLFDFKGDTYDSHCVFMYLPNKMKC